MRNNKMIVNTIAFSLILSPAVSQAGIVKNLLYGLGAANLQPRIQRDLLADGWRLDFGQNFINQEYDFGNAQLTLNGPLEGNFSISQRGIDEFEYHINTPAGLTFDFLEFDGVNKIQVQDGSAYISQDFTINKYGFYDLQLSMSVRGTLISDDPLALSKPLDFDIGPINIHGHWLVDVFNLLIGKNIGYILPGGATDTIVMGYYQEKNLQQLIADEVVKKIPDVEDESLQMTAPMIPLPEPGILTLILVGAGAIIRKRK